MSAWLVAGSLDQLLGQLNDLAPRRSKASDGSIGDPSHRARSSDHNPWCVIGGQAYVTARDFTHDPRGGLDCDWLATVLQAGRDPRIKYVIWQRQIMAGDAGPTPWRWRHYAGPNPHNHHLHLSVVADARALPRIAWSLNRAPAARPPALIVEDDDMRPDERDALFEGRDLLRLLKPGVARPARSTAAGGPERIDDHFGAALNAWAEAASARDGVVHVSQQVAELGAQLHNLAAASGADPDALAQRVADLLAERLRN